MEYWYAADGLTGGEMVQEFVELFFF
jgi:hypothetical protein